MVQQIGRSIAYSFWPQSPCSRWSVCKATLTLKKKLVLCCSQPHHLDNQDFHKKKKKSQVERTKVAAHKFWTGGSVHLLIFIFQKPYPLQVRIKESFKVFDNSRSTELDSLGPASLSQRILHNWPAHWTQKYANDVFFFRNRRVAISYVRADRWSWGHTKSFEWMTRQVHTLDKLR